MRKPVAAYLARRPFLFSSSSSSLFPLPFSSPVSAAGSAVLILKGSKGGGGGAEAPAPTPRSSPRFVRSFGTMEESLENVTARPPVKERERAHTSCGSYPLPEQSRPLFLSLSLYIPSILSCFGFVVCFCFNVLTTVVCPYLSLDLSRDYVNNK